MLIIIVICIVIYNMGMQYSGMDAIHKVGEQFRQFLIERKFVPDKVAPYMERWAVMFLAFARDYRGEPFKQVLERFVNIVHGVRTRIVHSLAFNNQKNSLLQIRKECAKLDLTPFVGKGQA